jgi:uncharacterized damage-inducible protein DinB
VPDPLIQSWQIHARIGVFVLNALSAEQLAAKAAPKGKSTADQFAHIHNVRLMWTKAAAPELLEGLQKIEKAELLEEGELANHLVASAQAIEALLVKSQEAGGKVKHFKPDVNSFVAYLISHESFHLGKIDMTLRLAGMPMDDKTHYGMWEWGVR